MSISSQGGTIGERFQLQILSYSLEDDRSLRFRPEMIDVK